MHFRKAKYAFGGAFLLIIKRKYSEKKTERILSYMIFSLCSVVQMISHSVQLLKRFFYIKNFVGIFKNTKKALYKREPFN